MSDQDYGELFRYRPPHKPPEFDAREGAKRRDESMGQADAHAKEEWRTAAYDAVIEKARSMPLFTADDVQLVLSTKPVKTHENRALGPIFLKAAKNGIIQDTGTFTRSTQVKCHLMPRRIWRSLICDEGGAQVPSPVIPFKPISASASA